MASEGGDGKKRQIVAAAVDLFSRYGYKNTSMSALAGAADVAKPTIYAHFDDKEAVFRAVVESVCEALLASARAEADRRGAPIESRLAAVLSAKFTRYFELVQASPHAQELVDSHSRLGAEIIKKSDRAFLKLVVSLIEGADELDTTRVGLNATSAAQLLLRAASGASYDATNVASHRKQLADTVRVIVAALRRS